MTDSRMMARIKAEINRRRINFAKKDYSYADLLEGAEIETEHSETVNGNVARIVDIALDHLDEFGNYYKGLKKMEKEMKQDTKKAYWLGIIDKCAEYGVDPNSLFKRAGKVNLDRLISYYRASQFRNPESLKRLFKTTIENSLPSTKKVLDNLDKYLEGYNFTPFPSLGNTSGGFFKFIKRHPYASGGAAAGSLGGGMLLDSLLNRNND